MSQYLFQFGAAMLAVGIVVLAVGVISTTREFMRHLRTAAPDGFSSREAIPDAGVQAAADLLDDPDKVRRMANLVFSGIASITVGIIVLVFASSLRMGF